MEVIRPIILFSGFLALTLPLMPVQYFLNLMGIRSAIKLPCIYHRLVCKLLDVRIRREGQFVRDLPTLLISNHVSWLDIPVLSSIAPVSFIAKQEVSDWPLIGWLAKLQRTIFINRQKKASVIRTNNQILERLNKLEFVVLFAEGTSSDGNSVLPFKSSLFGALALENSQTSLQTVALAYTKIHGLPIGRRDRPLVAWYGDMEMLDHAWKLLKAGPIDVHVKIGSPIRWQGAGDRKEIAKLTELQVKRNLGRMLYPRTG